MNVFLFGAGASFGAQKSNNPPLTKDLYDRLASFDNQGWKRLPPETIALMQDDFEAGMERVSGHLIGPLHRKMAEYFFGFEPDHTSLYRRLGARIAVTPEWQGALVTLNYERCLELAMQRSGMQPYCRNVRGQSGAIEICFPHGCCHLFCTSVRGKPGAIQFDARLVTTGGDVNQLNGKGAHQCELDTNVFPPVMCNIEPAKTSATGANFIADQKLRWNELATAAKTVLIVGVRVNSRDRHIWDPLAATSAAIVYCGGKGPEGSQRFAHWAATTRNGKRNTVFEGNFEEHFDDLCVAADLANASTSRGVDLK